MSQVTQATGDVPRTGFGYSSSSSSPSYLRRYGNGSTFPCSPTFLIPITNLFLFLAITHDQTRRSTKLPRGEEGGNRTIIIPSNCRRNLAASNPRACPKKPTSCSRDISNFCNTRQRCRSTCYFAMSVRVATGFRFVSLKGGGGRCPLISRGCEESCGIFPGEIVVALFPDALYLSTIIRSQLFQFST